MSCARARVIIDITDNSLTKTTHQTMQPASLDYGLQQIAKYEDRYIDFRLFDEIRYC